MNTLRRIRRWLGRCAGAFLCGVALYLLVAGVLTLIPVNRGFRPDPNGVEIFVLGDPVHTDICVPRRNALFDWDTLLPPFAVPNGLDDRIAFGWGDKAFYLEVYRWSDLTPARTFQSVFLPTPTAMHVDRKPYFGDEVRALKISAAQYLALVDFIRSGFRLDAQGRVLPIDHPGYYGSDRFYEANGSYHLLRTCNCWTNEALKAAGVKTATWAPLPQCVLYHLPAADRGR